MIGGYQILDLRSIDLQKSGSASSITDPYVLKQLLMFRDHIDKAYDFSKPLVNQLKPVLVRFRDKKSGEKTEGATFGELSVDGNYYTFKVTARISGALVLRISVAFQEITNDYGNKEWIINTATIQLKDESKSITGDLELTGDLAVGDDASISGDLSVVGDINGSDIDMSGKIEGAEIIEKMSGYSASYREVTGLTIENVYVGAVKNGNKLTVVGATNFTRTTELSGSKSYLKIVLPSAVVNKLYTTLIGIYNCLAFTQIKGVTASGLMKDINILIEKQSDGILVNLQGDTISNLPENEKTYIRFEATFLLSDSLISNE